MLAGLCQIALGSGLLLAVAPVPVQAVNHLLPDLVRLNETVLINTTSPVNGSTFANSTAPANSTASATPLSNSTQTSNFISNLDGFSKPNNLVNFYFIFLILLVVVAYFALRYYQKRRQKRRARLFSSLRAEALQRDIEADAAARASRRPPFSDMVQVDDSNNSRNPFLSRRRPSSPPPPPPPYTPDMPRAVDAAYLGGGMRLPMYEDVVEDETEDSNQHENTEADHDSDADSSQQSYDEWMSGRVTSNQYGPSDDEPSSSRASTMTSILDRR